MININEMMLKVGLQNHSRGKMTMVKRCDAKGVCKKGSGQADLLMAIGGESKFKCMFCLWQCNSSNFTKVQETIPFLSTGSLMRGALTFGGFIIL